MKLYTTDNLELMNIEKIEASANTLLVTGTIMGAVPVKAVVKPEEMRVALGQMSMSTKLKAAYMVLGGFTSIVILVLAVGLVAALIALR